MKHIKKFNELNTQTYYNAARQFHKMGKTNPDFKKRAYELENWAEIIKSKVLDFIPKEKQNDNLDIRMEKQFRTIKKG